VHWIRYDVFLSYSHRDSAATDAFVTAIRARGYRVFYDKKSIAVGEPWKVRLGKAIAESRVCILCWSAEARNSEYVAFEYARAEGLRKAVLPWLLDATPLPQMIEIQGVVERDPARAAAQFLPHLGWRLALRRGFQAICLAAILLAGGAAWWRTHQPPPPWEFRGRVVDSETRLPIADVRVEAEGDRFAAYTDSEGRYLLRFPLPKPKHVHLVFLKQGYRGEVPVNVSPDRPFDTDMTRVR
jgi:hypothetical protein